MEAYRWINSAGFSETRDTITRQNVRFRCDSGRRNRKWKIDLGVGWTPTIKCVYEDVSPAAVRREHQPRTSHSPQYAGATPAVPARQTVQLP